MINKVKKGIDIVIHISWYIFALVSEINSENCIVIALIVFQLYIEQSSKVKSILELNIHIKQYSINKQQNIDRIGKIKLIEMIRLERDAYRIKETLKRSEISIFNSIGVA